MPSTAQLSLHPSSPVPRGERRRREIAAVAERVFFDHGFTETTMQTIAAHAGASKETLYRHFGSKEELFAEIVETRARRFLDSLDENVDRPGSVAQALRETGIRIMESIFGVDGIRLCRIVIAESPRNPELGRIFLEEGPYRTRRHLIAFLDAACRRGELVCGDTMRAATILLGALISAMHVERLVLQSPPELTPEQATAHVEETVAMFMARYGSTGF